MTLNLSSVTEKSEVEKKVNIEKESSSEREFSSPSNHDLIAIKNLNVKKAMVIELAEMGLSWQAIERVLCIRIKVSGKNPKP